jgi:GNAT superfamily N-acetyltransferase
MQFELRPATAADMQFAYAVTEAAMRGYVEAAFGPWLAEFQKAYVANSFDPGTHQIIVTEGESAGIVATQVHDTHVQLEKLYLLPQFQRLAIGSGVLSRIIQMATALNKPVRLRVLAVNSDAQRFYKNKGFVVYDSTPERVFMEYSAQD